MLQAGSVSWLMKVQAEQTQTPSEEADMYSSVVPTAIVAVLVAVVGSVGRSNWEADAE